MQLCSLEPGRFLVGQNLTALSGNRALPDLLIWEKLSELGGLAVQGRPTHPSGVDSGETLN